MHLKLSAAKWRPFCSGGDELTLPMLGSMVAIWNRSISALVPFQYKKNVFQEYSGFITTRKGGDDVYVFGAIVNAWKWSNIMNWI